MTSELMVDPFFQSEVSIICRNKQSVNLLKTCDIMHLESAQAIDIDILFAPQRLGLIAVIAMVVFQ